MVDFRSTTTGKRRWSRSVVDSDVERAGVGPAWSGRTHCDRPPEGEVSPLLPAIVESQGVGTVDRQRQRLRRIALIGQRDVRRGDAHDLVVRTAYGVHRDLGCTTAGHVGAGAREDPGAGNADGRARPISGTQHNGTEIEVLNRA